MCSPALASMGTQAAGVGMSTVGAFYSAKQAQDAYRSQARIAEINAKIADSNARAEVEQGTFKESQIKFQGTRLKSSQTARFAAGGVDIAGSNSALAVLTGTDVLTEADANQTRANATRAAWGQRIEAGNMRRGATSLRASASGISPGLAAASSLISGAGQVATSWYGLDRQGAFESAPKEGTATMLVEGPPPEAHQGHGVTRDPIHGSQMLKLWGW